MYKYKQIYNMPTIHILTMLYVRLVRVQLISGETPGRIEKATFKTIAIKIFVNQVPRRLNQVLFGFSNLLVHIQLSLHQGYKAGRLKNKIKNN